MTLVLVGLGQAEEPEFLGRTAAAEADRHPAFRQDVRHGDLLGDVEGVVKVQADDRRAQANVTRLARHVQREQQRRWQVPVMCMGMVLREPGVLDAQLVGQPDQVRHFIKDQRRWTIPRSLEVVGQADREWTHSRFAPVFRVQQMNARYSSMAGNPQVLAER